MDLGLTDTAYLVTAASSGLGRATADQLVAEGARVVIVGRREHLLAEAVARLGADRVAVVAGDLADPAVAEQSCDTAMSRFGRIDGALVSVGGPPAGPALAVAEQDWLDAFGSVFLPALRVTKAVLARAAGRPVAVGWVLSTSVKSPIGGLAISNGLRPGLAMLVKQLADEIGPQGHRILGLMPGRIETERVQHLDSLSDDPSAARARAESSIPLRRSGRPEEFARVATFALSPAASYLTGCVLPVEGGALRAL